MVMLKIFSNELSLPKQVPTTTEMQGKAPEKAMEEDVGTPEEMAYFLKGVGKLIHIMRWSSQEIYNSVQYLSRQMSEATKEHIDAMHRVM